MSKNQLLGNIDSKETASSLKNELNELTDTMREAEQFHTLKEQVDSMKRRGIDPTENYNKNDKTVNDEWIDEDWGDDTWKENGQWKRKTPSDLK